MGNYFVAIPFSIVALHTHAQQGLSDCVCPFKTVMRQCGLLLHILQLPGRLGDCDSIELWGDGANVMLSGKMRRYGAQV